MNHHRIAFGSCNNQELTNKLWPVIESRRPTAYIWGGDAIYADQHVPMDWTTFPPTSRTECATPERLHALYRYQKSVPGYKQLLESNITVFGTMDDHDFGCNNGDSTYQYRHESGVAFVDFLDEPMQSAMRLRAQEGLGVYGVKLFDFDRPSGSQEVPETEACVDPDACLLAELPYPSAYSNKTVAVFVLDVRTHKSPWKTGSAAFRPDLEGDFLGEAQWKWFETAIRQSRASVNVIVNGLQVHANRFSNANIAESWDKFPRSRQRLYDAVLQSSVRSPILISGDVHMTQLMRKDCVQNGAAATAPTRPLMELTTSGMTHSWASSSSPPLFADEAMQRLSWQDHLGRFAAASLMSSMHKMCPWTELVHSNAAEVSQGSFANGGAEGSKQGLQFSLEKNFGELEFDWEKQVVSLRSIGEDGSALLSARLSMAQLSGDEEVGGSKIDDTDFRIARESLLGALPDSEWVCVNHRGIDTPTAHMIGHVSSAMLTVTVVGLPLLLPAVLLFFIYRRFLAFRRTSYSFTSRRVY
jgi:hypothetical protein